MVSQTAKENMADVRRFLSLLRTLDGSPHPVLRSLFRSDKPIVIARAPGRLDVMGGIADYSGSLVLQLPIAEATFAAVQATEDETLQVVSMPSTEGQAPRTASMSCREWIDLCDQGYGAIHDRIGRDDTAGWAAYVYGTIAVLVRERQTGFGGGLRILIDSQVPEAKGVSSSAALEVASMSALAPALGESLDGKELARLCQLAENRVVGAPCGIMDQMTSALGRRDHLLALRCQPACVEGFVAVPESIGCWGIDSGIRHAVSGSDYTSVRTGAFMGYRIIAEAAGLEVGPKGEDGTLSVTDPQWHGYLANVDPSEFADRYADRLPQVMDGQTFLEAYGGTTDTVTRVNPRHRYAVYQPTAHPIHEHRRVQQFARLLASAPTEEVLGEMGELMYGSHASYTACGLGSEGTDRLVDLVRRAGPSRGLFGAKITGGGSGGTVAVLGRADAAQAVADVAAQYTEQTGRESSVFTGSSLGACEFGCMCLDGESVRWQ